MTLPYLDEATGRVFDKTCEACSVGWDASKWYHAKKCPVAKALRDTYCTPKALAGALGRFTLDPCSNPRSAIAADRTCALESNTDGLAISWAGEDVFVNGPFSNLLPWAEKLGEARTKVFLCNTDHSTRWWKAAVAAGCIYRFDLGTRQQFDPPPHIRRSTNNKPQSLLCDWGAAVRIDKALVGMGQWWMVRDGVPAGGSECSV